MNEGRMNGGTELLAGATRESWRAVADAAVRQQEQAARFALGWIDESIGMLKEQAEMNTRLTRTLAEQSEKQAEALHILARETTGALTDLLFAPILGKEPGAVEGDSQPAKERTNGQHLPIEDYDRLSVEEVSRRLEELDAKEKEELKTYERAHKNRPALIERFERSLG